MTLRRFRSVPSTPTRPRLRTLIGLGGLAGITMAALLGLAPAQAHNGLVSANPAAGAVVTQQVDTVVITTSDVLLDSGTDSPTTFIQVRGPGEAELYYGDGCATVDGASVTTPVQLGEAGEYTVYWGVVSTDGHPITGDYSFTWQPAEGQELSDGLAASPSCGVDATESSAPDTAAPVAPTESASTTPAADQENTSRPVADILRIGVALGLLVFAAIVVLLVERWRARQASPAHADSDHGGPRV